MVVVRQEGVEKVGETRAWLASKRSILVKTEAEGENWPSSPRGDETRWLFGSMSRTSLDVISVEARERGKCD